MYMPQEVIGSDIFVDPVGIDHEWEGYNFEAASDYMGGQKGHFD